MLREDGIERTVSRDAFEGNVWNTFTLERQLLACCLAFVVYFRNLRPFEITIHVFGAQLAELVEVKLRREQSVLCQGQCYPARIARYPASAPLFGHI